MWIKNKKTNLIWEVTNESQIKKLLDHKDYTESRKSTAEKKTEAKKES